MINVFLSLGKFIGAVGVSILCVLTSLQNDPWLKERLEQQVRQIFSEAVGEGVAYKVDSVDLLRGVIKGSSLASSSSKGDWSFFCSHVDVQFSWLSLFKSGEIEMAVALSKSRFFTRYEDNAFALEKPLYALLTIPSFLPVRFLGSTTTDTVADIVSSVGIARVSCSSVTSAYPREITHRLFFTEGSFTAYEKGTELKEGPLEGPLIAQLVTGTLSVDMPIPYTQDYEVKASFLTDWYTRSKECRRCVVGYSYKQGGSSFHWYPETCETFIRATDMRFQNDKLEGKAEVWGNLTTLTDCFPVVPQLKGSDGEVDFKGTISLCDSENFSYKGVLGLSSLTYQGTALPPATCLLSGTHNEAEGTLSFSPGVPVEGSWSWNKATNIFKGMLDLTSPCTFGSRFGCEVASCGFSCSPEELKAAYKATVRLNEQESLPCEGTVTSDFQRVAFEGKMQDAAFSTCLDLESRDCKELCYTYKGKRVVDIQKEGSVFQGLLDFDYLKKIVTLCTGYELQGTAQVMLEPRIHNNNRYELRVELKDAHIKVPFANAGLIKEGHALIEFDKELYQLKIMDLEVKLAKGVVRSPCITIDLSPEGKPTFIHAPCTVDALFVSWNKDVSATLSGGGVATYAHDKWGLRGTLILDKALVQGNLFSTNLSSGFENSVSFDEIPAINLDVHCATRRPLVIETSFFEAQARLDVHLKGTSSALQPQGVLELIQGSICFPYKPLYIAKGKLSLAPHMIHGPEIELVAKNKIKKYALTMQVTGSVVDPKITFESSPHLSEASIITLLLTGSEEASFYLAMSHVVMMHIKSILFGAPDRLSDAQKFFKSLITPLSKVRIVPTLNEDKVLEGAIEVDITDRLRAKAHNDVHFSDETQLEVEYAVSDDISLKAVRDDKGAFGGELEMRWKF